jgi:hypothetical protein
LGVDDGIIDRADDFKEDKSDNNKEVGHTLYDREKQEISIYQKKDVKYLHSRNCCDRIEGFIFLIHFYDNPANPYYTTNAKEIHHCPCGYYCSPWSPLIFDTMRSQSEISRIGCAE